MDFVDFLGHLYAAAQVLESSPEGTWQRYEKWIRWAFASWRRELLEDIQAASGRLGLPPQKAPEVTAV